MTFSFTFGFHIATGNGSERVFLVCSSSRRPTTRILRHSRQAGRYDDGGRVLRRTEDPRVIVEAVPMIPLSIAIHLRSFPF